MRKTHSNDLREGFGRGGLRDSKQLIPVEHVGGRSLWSEGGSGEREERKERRREGGERGR